MVIVHMITQRGLDLIKHFESFRSEPYICAGGYLSVGYGHVIKPNEVFLEVTEAEAEALLLADVAIAERSVLRLIRIPLEDNRFDALVSFTFNVGGGGFQRSTLRQKVNREEHEEVPDEFRKWVYAGGRKLKGLIKRRELEASLYQGGELCLV